MSLGATSAGDVWSASVKNVPGVMGDGRREGTTEGDDEGKRGRRQVPPARHHKALTASVHSTTGLGNKLSVYKNYPS